MAAQRGHSGGNNCLRAVEWKGVPNLMKKTILREYARLIVRSGVNVQKGQDVLIYADLDQPEFVQMVVEEAYKAKARKVTVNWNYQPLQKLHVRYQSVKTLGTVQIQDLSSGELLEFRITGSQEANPMMGKMSDDSPFGRALVGHGPGEVVTVEAPAGRFEAKILSVTR